MPEAISRLMPWGMFDWIKGRERRILLLTAAAQLLVLMAMIAVRMMPLVTGQTVLVRVQPVDPRDLLRGDYVILSYDFSRTPTERIQGLTEADRWNRKTEGRPVYVALVPDSDGVHMRAAQVSLLKPVKGPFLKGQMGRYGSMEFGIEAYYVQEGTGRAYEQAIRDRKLTAELAVTSGGQAALRGLRID